MKVESKLIQNEIISSNILTAINQYISDIQTEFEDQTIIEITSIKVDIKNNNVYITYNDYSEEQTKLQNIISDAISIKTQIENELSNEVPDQVKLATLYGQLNNLNDEFNKIKQILNITYELSEVI